MILYTGPSMLDGSPIVVIATAGSNNVKTGPMIQTWILRADLDPVEAKHAGADSSVCGQCPHRHFLGGSCYVQPYQAPRSIWYSWWKGNYDGPEAERKVRAAIASGNASCDEPPVYTVLTVSDAGFGAGDFSRCGIRHLVWAKTGGTWSQVMSYDGEPLCAELKDHDVPPGIAGANCQDADGSRPYRG